MNPKGSPFRLYSIADQRKIGKLQAMEKEVFYEKPATLLPSWGDIPENWRKHRHADFGALGANIEAMWKKHSYLLKRPRHEQQKKAIQASGILIPNEDV